MNRQLMATLWQTIYLTNLSYVFGEARVAEEQQHDQMFKKKLHTKTELEILARSLKQKSPAFMKPWD